MDEKKSMAIDDFLKAAQCAPNIWKQAPVEIVPEKFLLGWSIAKVVRIALESRAQHTLNTYHFVGEDRRNRNGAVSSTIIKFDSITMRGTTESGRVYQLDGMPDAIRGFQDSHYTLSGWEKVNGVECEDATLEFVKRHGINLKNIEMMSR